MGMGVDPVALCLNSLQPTGWATARGCANTLQICGIISGYGEPAMRARANANPVSRAPIIHIMLAFGTGFGMVGNFICWQASRRCHMLG